MYDFYLALGDSMSIDHYPYQDACNGGFAGRKEIGAASLLFENEPLLFPDFGGDDLKTRFANIGYSNHAVDGATTEHLLTDQRQAELQPFSGKRNLITLTLGGNDLLLIYTSTKLSDTDALLDAMIALQRRYVRVVQLINKLLPNSKLILTTVFDPTDGTGVMASDRFFGDKLPIEFLDQFNNFVKKYASESGALLADVHQHFLGHGSNAGSATDFWYFAPSPIEPSYRGASEIRRVWLNTLSQPGLK
ncbi:MAG TPA: SGNH/GDSL hydrolase family protein [Drouetiella sp.]|jgi:GDSL-like Lipase/Acylhydrolase family